jgi:hypothetical protein
MLFGAISFFAFGCGGSVNANASAKASTDGEADFDAAGDGGVGWEQTPETQNGAAAGSETNGSSGSNEGTLLGARHDLLLAEGAPVTCKCLSAIVGQPGTPKMIWTGRKPIINAQSQTVIVLGSEGIPCTEATTGASYMGYEMKDGNVIVNVEAAVAGRPVTHGAIIPQPSAGGQIYVQPAGSIPYGRGTGGEARCALGAGK